jgi:hypothetical protein
VANTLLQQKKTTSKKSFFYQADSKAFSQAKERKHSNIEIFA